MNLTIFWFFETLATEKSATGSTRRRRRSGRVAVASESQEYSIFKTELFGKIMSDITLYSMWSLVNRTTSGQIVPQMTALPCRSGRQSKSPNRGSIQLT